MMKIIVINRQELHNKICKSKRFILILLVILIFGSIPKAVLAQTSVSTLYIPLIGITSVPNPLALPNGEGYVTYNYAVKSFIKEDPLSDIHVVDDKCSPIKFLNGDDNGDSKLDYNETWRFSCTTQLSETTQSTAIATGRFNGITATHKAYATVVVGQKNPAPLVSVINITKVAYPLSLPSKGGNITFTYKVNNPGLVPLSNVVITDDKCETISGKLGDTNGNNLLDINEVWIYTCTANLKRTTTNTVNVTAFANGFKANSSASITVKVDSSIAQSSPKFPIVGGKPNAEVNLNARIVVWSILSGIIVILIVFFILSRKSEIEKVIKSIRPQDRGKKQ